MTSVATDTRDAETPSVAVRPDHGSSVPTGFVGKPAGVAARARDGSQAARSYVLKIAFGSLATVAVLTAAFFSAASDIALLAAMLLAGMTWPAVTLIWASLVARYTPARFDTGPGRSKAVEQEPCAVAYPILLGGMEVKRFLDRLVETMKGNVGLNVQFYILADLPDHASPHAPHDDALADELRGLVREIFSSLPMPPPTILLRRRVYAPAEGCWMGWERKRGKLLEFAAVLNGGRHTTFVSPETVSPADRLITLDADAVLLPGGVKRLSMAYSDARSAGVHGRAPGIAAPSIRVEPEPGGERFFRRYWTQIDTPAEASFHQRSFGSGVFYGKGLIGGAELADTARVIPVGAVLSHDHLEGALVGVVECPEACLIERHPRDWQAWACRQERWVRGDWQLLPWVFARPESLSLIGRWKLLENLLSHSAALCLVSLIVIAAFWPSGILFLVLCAALGILLWLHFGGLARTALGNLADHVEGRRRWSWKRIQAELVSAAKQGAFQAIHFPGHLAISLCGATRAVRRLVTRRHRLRWAGTDGERRVMFGLETLLALTPAVAAASLLMMDRIALPVAALMVAVAAAWLCLPRLFASLDGSGTRP